MSRSGAELCGRCGSKTEGVGYGQRQWRSHVAWTRGARAGPGAWAWGAQTTESARSGALERPVR